MVVDGRHQEDALAGELEGDHLDHHRERLDHEDAADHREQDLLADQHRDGAERAAERERAHVAHEELGRRGVEPEEAQAAADQRAAEDREGAAARHVLDGQVVGDDGVPGGVGEQQEGARRDHDRADGEPVEAVGEVHGVAGADDDEGGDRDVEPAQVRREVLEEGHRELGVEARVGVDGERHRERQQRLPEELHARRDAGGVSLGDLAVVVDEAEQAVAHGDAEHGPHEAVVEVRPEQHRDQAARAGSAARPSSACRPCSGGRVRCRGSAAPRAGSPAFGSAAGPPGRR